MKLGRLIRYIESSFEGKPSFVFLMPDEKEYISNGCQFVENTEENRRKLICKYDCKHYLDELLSSAKLDDDISKITIGCAKLGRSLTITLRSQTGIRQLHCLLSDLEV